MAAFNTLPITSPVKTDTSAPDSTNLPIKVIRKALRAELKTALFSTDSICPPSRTY
jgi:hypothetical protein